MKRLLTGLIAALFALSAVSCGSSAPVTADTSAETEATSVPEAEEPFVPTNHTAENLFLTGHAGSYTREILDVPDSDKYMLSATVSVTKLLSGAQFGLCAGSNPQGQTIDLLTSVGSDVFSYASLYGSELRSDLGEIRTAARFSDKDPTMTVIRDGDLFYLINGSTLCQIREFPCYSTAPGFTAMSASVSFAKIEYTNDPQKVDAAIASYMSGFAGYGFGEHYANFGGINFINENSFSVDSDLMKKGVEYTRMAFAGSYSGDMEVSFTVSGLQALASADNSGDAMCRLRLLVYCDNDVIDMICLGVANKQDRIETFAYYDIAQWFYHTDLTGDAGYFDWSKDNRIRIRITNTNGSNTYTVYVNDALYAIRSSCVSGSVSFGFEAENVYGTVSNFKVTGGDSK